MKKSAILALMVAVSAVSSFGQGSVIFNNRVTGAGGVVAPIYGVNPTSPTQGRQGNATTNGGAVDYTGAPLLTGTSFSAELLGDTGAGFASLSTVLFRTTPSLAGFIAPPSLAVNTPVAAAMTFKVRAWNNGGVAASTYSEALGAGRAVGESLSFVLAPTAPPSTPPNLIGLTSFNLTVVPEPGVIALGVLGLGALLLRRRK